MYYTIVRRNVMNGFARLSQGDSEPILRLFAPDVHFKFYGDHALGADVCGVDLARQWFSRMLGLFPGIKIQPRHVFVKGLPWDTQVSTHFTLTARLPDGSAYENTGTQFLRIKWGRIFEDYIVEDTQKLVGALEMLTKHGKRDAAALPLVS